MSGTRAEVAHRPWHRFKANTYASFVEQRAMVSENILVGGEVVSGLIGVILGRHGG